MTITILQTELRIAALLAELEIATGHHVESIGVVNTDISTIAEAIPRWSRRVHIDIRPTPGSNWVTT